MLAQYVFTAANAIFRIVRHGHRWRALRDTIELGRFETAEAAMIGLRDMCRDVRLPRRLTDWRFLPPAALGHLAPPSPAVLARLSAA